MITLHEVYEQGNEAVKEAVRAFGARHPLGPARSDAEPDWKTAEKHFTHVIEVIMGTAALAEPDTVGTVRRAENVAVQLLLTLHTVRGYRCPICVKKRRDRL
ncbi:MULTISPECIES: hypothetical protein [unclassified Streptomyces]|uniref:hypothetical protein n=1 Tax=unclassified Streptomyces TaxID=2593676 RepID=UPI00378FE466